MPPPRGEGVWPNPGPQEAALASPADIVVYGGANGGGKTWALLVEPLRHVGRRDFYAVIFRRTSPEITNPGGLWDESFKLYPGAGGVPKETPRHSWTFPSGARIEMAHLQYDKDKTGWDGSQVPLFEFDQLESFEASQFWYMLSRNRNPSANGVRPYIRASCNPVPSDDKVGGWLRDLVAWWIDPDTGLPLPERSGVLRWFVRDGESLVWSDDRASLAARYRDPGGDPNKDNAPLSLTFIPARLEDNPPLERADPGYRAKLMQLPLVERARRLGGNWNARPPAGSVFDRAWFGVVAAAPVDARRVRAWDKAGTEGAGKYSAGVRMSESRGTYYVEDVSRGQWSSLRRNDAIRQAAALDGAAVAVWVEQEPGSGGKESAEITVRELAGYDVRALPATGDKVTRAGPLSAQAEAGNVKLVAGAWNADFLAELHAFPDGKYSDQVDAASLAFNRLALGAGRGVRVVSPGGAAPPRRVLVRG